MTLFSQSCNQAHGLLPCYSCKAYSKQTVTRVSRNNKVCCCRQWPGKTCVCLQVSTVVLRASTDNTLDDLERAVDDGVNAYKVCIRML